MRNKLTHVMIALGVMTLSTSACTSPSAVERSFGEAVKSNVQAQVYDPTTITAPSTEAVEGTDGQRMEGVMESLRGRQGSADSVAEPIVINVGN
jgi:type IV pilus biogenesis protein CpaD/CtpE